MENRPGAPMTGSARRAAGKSLGVGSEFRYGVEDGLSDLLGIFDSVEAHRLSDMYRDLPKEPKAQAVGLMSGNV